MAWTHRKDLKLAEPVPYKCAFVSTQVNTIESVLTDSLKTPGTGWLSAPYADNPQTIVLDMVYLTNVVKILITPHKTCRPETVEVWSSRAEDREDKKYKSLGVVVFQDKIDRRPPDSKPLFVDTLAKWLWFQVGPPKPYENNPKKQVGIDQIQVFGYFNKPPSPPPEDPKRRGPRDEGGRLRGSGGVDDYDEFSGRLHRKYTDETGKLVPPISINNYYGGSPTSPDPGSGVRPRTTTKCDHANNDPDARYCGKCGERIGRKRSTYCGKCGSSRISGEGYCRNCGAHQDE